MIVSKRNKGENFESFFRRHNKRVLRSGRPKEVRARQYRPKKINKALKKKMALFGRVLHRNREYLKKIGKLKDDVTKRW
ncbi:MAG: hypothetical protein NT091_05285 [Candidatus Falkowbacteria bacterium]|nr:hypothetical protein [Candidatus Falkowbacteria bacterium]